MFWSRMVRNNTLLLLVVMVTTLHRFRPVSAAVVVNHNVRMTGTNSQEGELKQVTSKENYIDLERITKLHHDQQMARWTRTKMAAGPTSWPCPDPTAISPCTCDIADPLIYELDIDCSSATTDSDLTNAFSVVFPFDDIANFSIVADSASNTFSIFDQNMFQSKWFSSVYVVDTNLEMIEDGVFALSHDTLETLSLQRNKIIEFPFEIILEYTKLRYIHLNGNNIKELPRLSSNTIHEVNMNNNHELVLQFDIETFVGTPELRSIRLSHTAISRVPANLFKTLEHIGQIELSGNGITALEPEAINAPGPTITKLDLSENSLTDTVELGSITGLALDGQLNLMNNAITDLMEEIWKPIFDQLGSAQAPAVGSIILDGNPLRCGCEVNWIIIDDIQWKKISAGTTCPGGQLFSTLDINFYLTNCPQPGTVLNLV